MKRINLRDLLTPLENTAYILPINMHITVSFFKKAETKSLPLTYSLASHYRSRTSCLPFLFLTLLTCIDPSS